MFLEQFKFHNANEGKVQRFSVCPLHPHMHSLSHYQPHSLEWFVTKNEPTYTHHNPPKATVTLLRVYTCIFYVLGQINV